MRRGPEKAEGQWSSGREGRNHRKEKEGDTGEGKEGTMIRQRKEGGRKGRKEP